MTERLELWQLLWRSGWSSEAYRQVASARVRRLFGYLALLIVIATVIVSVRAHVSFQKLVVSFKTEKTWERQFPEIQISKGKASSPAQQPFVWEGADFVFILDTTGTTTDLSAQYRQGVLVTDREIVVHRQRGLKEERRYSLQGVPDMVINQAALEGMLEAIIRWVGPMVAIVMFLWFWIAKLLQVLLGSLIGLLVNALSGRSLRYAALFNIAVYALTIPWIFDLLKDGLGWHHRSLAWISIGMYLVWDMWGILVQPRTVTTSSNLTQESMPPHPAGRSGEAASVSERRKGKPELSPPS